jgi:hypothetical protein
MSQHDVRATLGAILVGSGIASILTGVVTTQTVYYFQHYHDDKAQVKFMVVVVWLLDILHTSMIFASDWLWLIEHFGDPEISKWIPWSLGLTVVLTATITIIVHTFFVYRLYCLSKGNWFIVAPLLVLACLRLGFASTTCAKMLIYANFDKFVQNVSWVFTMGLVTSSVLDVITTSCLLWYLDKTRTGFAGMDQIVNTLSLYAVENGLLTTVAILISLGFWLGMKGNLVFMATHFVVAKLYANALLATLNSRKEIRGRHRRAPSDGPQMGSAFTLRRPTMKRPSDFMGGGVQINVEKSVMKDDEEAGIILSPVRSHATLEKRSMDTFLTSKTGTIEEYTMR